MSKEEILSLVRECRSAADWDYVCGLAKAEGQGKYPDWWYDEVILSGLFSEVSKRQ